ncbi:20536_t:CDS:2 [Cetraspora pellucida]|uniref:20536_t:CDS:1 n=1 Tax=Cetraspora pellucida TaxID=1433469 RepID=A0A9N9H2U3_9GLOM|nr:20536_t:CDS:2 [Cetraspora pellucida]
MRYDFVILMLSSCMIHKLFSEKKNYLPKLAFTNHCFFYL